MATQTVVPDVSTTNTVTSPSTQLRSSAWRLVSQQLLNLAVITAFLSIAGFFVVHTYLGKVTGIYTYRIEAPVYIAAGINAVLGTLWLVLSPIAASSPDMLLLIMILVGTLLLADTILKSRFMRSFPYKELVSITQQLYRLNTRLTVVLLILLSMATAITYGTHEHGYGYSDRALGGGKPSPIILIFKESGMISSLGLPIQQNSIYGAQSEPIELLMELNDGLLVRDPQFQIPLIIRDELIYGIIDARSQLISPTPTPLNSTITPTPASP